jgi:F420H(2)-dependent quinone reductase
MIFSLANSQRGMEMFHLFVRLIDIPTSRLTRGAFIPSATGNIMPIFYLTTTGAKTKTPHSIPVLSVPDGENLILVGSNWGNLKNPSWVYNLRAYPKAQVCKGKMKKDFTAHELHGDERAAYWQKAVTFYPPYTSYEQKSGRLLPVFLLKP